jgi:hypothetical protein
MVATSDKAMVKRARFAFTDTTSWSFGCDRPRRPGGLGEIPGFASPPRDGFALDEGSTPEADLAPVLKTIPYPGVGRYAPKVLVGSGVPLSARRHRWGASPRPAPDDASR